MTLAVYLEPGRLDRALLIYICKGNGDHVSNFDFFLFIVIWHEEVIKPVVGGTWKVFKCQTLTSDFSCWSLALYGVYVGRCVKLSRATAMPLGCTCESDFTAAYHETVVCFICEC